MENDPGEEPLPTQRRILSALRNLDCRHYHLGHDPAGYWLVAFRLLTPSADFHVYGWGGFCQALAIAAERGHLLARDAM